MMLYAFPLSQIEDSNLVEKVAQQMPIQEIATEKFQGPHLGIRNSANLMEKNLRKKLQFEYSWNNCFLLMNIRQYNTI